VFLCEATWQGDATDYPDGIHLTARQAGEVATTAGARRLVLTHIAGGLDRSVSQHEASETFDGPVEVAEEMHDYQIR
jgi:ribonuclease BN (tRNA processing enzyme)